MRLVRHLPILVLCAALCMLGLPLAAAAQEAGADEDPLFADADAEVQPFWQWQAEALLRAESTTGFAARDDLERLRSRLRIGASHAGDRLSASFALKLAAGSDHNRDNRANLDNEASNGLAVDEAVLRWAPADGHEIQLGKSTLPLATTPLFWDLDLRPIGLAWTGNRPSGDFDRWSAVAGYFAGDHLYGDRSRIGAAQFGWHFREGAPFSAEVLLGWLRFDDLDRAFEEGLMRSNRTVDGRLASRFRLFDLQLAARWQLDDHPLDLRLDLLRNQGAERERDGARFTTVYGRADHAHAWEVALAWQRIGRDAVPAAFSADDWWFHSAARGIMPWVAYAFDDTWSLQLSGFRERLDGRDDHIHRLLLDLRARW